MRSCLHSRVVVDDRSPWRELADGLTSRSRELLGTELLGVYLHGSAALGGWVRGSDLDVLVIVGDRAELDWASIGEVVAASGHPVPLELSVVRAADARWPAPPWPYVLHVATHPGEGPARIVVGAAGTGDPDLALHYLVVHTHGQVVHGPAPTTLVGQMSRRHVLRHLRDELQWGLCHADEKYAVLNACRAQAYAIDGLVLSKTGGAQWASAHLGDFTQLIGRAKLAQQDGILLGPSTEETHRLVRDVTRTLDCTT